MMTNSYYIVVSEEQLGRRTTKKQVRDMCGLPKAPVWIKRSGLPSPVLASFILPLLGSRVNILEAVCIGPLTEDEVLTTKLQLPFTPISTIGPLSASDADRAVEICDELRQLDSKINFHNKDLCHIHGRRRRDTLSLTQMSLAWSSFRQKFDELISQMEISSSKAIKTRERAIAETASRARSLLPDLIAIIRTATEHDHVLSALDDHQLSSDLLFIFARSVILGAGSDEDDE